MSESKFPKAIEVKQTYVLEDGSVLESQRYKTLVSSEDPSVEYNTVSKGYKVAQHDEVNDKLEAALSDLKLENFGGPDMRLLKDTQGARLHIRKTFPDIGLQVEGEYFNLTITVDNSYDSTTGLRVEVGACTRDARTQMYVAERFASTYHKHTKGMMVDNVKASINKGISTFQNKVKAEFERMVQTQIDPAKASIRFQDLTKDEDTVLPQKYLNEIKKAVDAQQPKTQWKLYKLVMEVMTPFDMSVERRRQLTHALVKVIRSLHA